MPLTREQIAAAIAVTPKATSIKYYDAPVASPWPERQRRWLKLRKKLKALNPQTRFPSRI